MTLRYCLACFQSTLHTWHNILMAEEISQCPLASPRGDTVNDRAGVWFLAACYIMMHRLVTFRMTQWNCSESSDPVNGRIFCLARGRTPALWTTISCQWTIANLLRKQNIVEEPKYNDKIHEKCWVGLCILGCFVDYYKLDAEAKPTTKRKKKNVCTLNLNSNK
jgi:hypothetical protein